MKTNTLAFDRPSLFKMTWPIFIELGLQVLVTNVDQFMVSQSSENAVGAVGIANQIINVLILMFSVISMATTILVSQYMGANNYKKISEIYSLAVVVNTVFSAIVSVFLLFCNELIYKWMLVPVELKEDFTNYIKIVGGFMFLQAIFMTFSAIFRSNALMKESMFLSIVINIVNVFFNWLLIYGIGPFPKMGVAGAAIATNISKFIGLIMIIYLYNKHIKVKISIKQLIPFPINTFKRLIKIGVPSGGEGLSYSFTQIIIMLFINKLGAIVIETKTIGSMFAMIACLFATAIGTSTQILVGYLIGSKNPNQANKEVWKTTIMSIIISVGFTAILFTFSDVFFGLFSKSPEVLELGKKIIFIEIFLEAGRATNLIMVRSLQAAGDIKFPVLVGIASTWLVSVAFSFILGIVLGWGLVGIWVAMACDEILRAIIFTFRWKSGVWRNKKLIEE